VVLRFPALYPHLLQPLNLGFVTLANRMVMGSMHTGFEESPTGLRRLADFYAERCRAGVGLVVTGGFSPNAAGCPFGKAAQIVTEADAEAHRPMVQAVHAAGGRILLQLLHAGRYALHPGAVAPSAIQSPTSPFCPRELAADEIEATIEDFVRAARLAQSVGYDGVELMGSEGYLVNQFIAARTNQRTDHWGGTLDNRLRFPVELTRRVRAAAGPAFIVMFRLSVADLVPGGSTFAETVELAQRLERAGVSIVNTGIGWHESRVPTIHMSVPAAAFVSIVGRLKANLTAPVAATNRINRPDIAERVLAAGQADLVVLARPLLADPDFVQKLAAGRADEIRPCVACNQGCLDRIFEGRELSCLANPTVVHQGESRLRPAVAARRIAVVGAGPAGLACAATLAGRGHRVVIFEARPWLGGQLDLARRVPGREEFGHLVSHFSRTLVRLGVEIRLNAAVTAQELGRADFAEIVVATGTRPRSSDLDGVSGVRVLNFTDVLLGCPVGPRVAILGGGGVGFEVAEFLSDAHSPGSQDIDAYCREWGVDRDGSTPGFLSAVTPQVPRADRVVYLLQRKGSKMGKNLGRTTGWIRHARLVNRGVQMIPGVRVQGIDQRGLVLTIGQRKRVLEVDDVVVCIGQVPVSELADELRAAGLRPQVIGGARDATALSAERAIREGVDLGGAL